VHDLAHQIVTKFGMSDRIGFMCYHEDQYGNKSYSNETAKLIDEEKKRLVDECTVKTREIILERRDKITELSEKLLEKESLEFRDIYAILGPKPYGERSSFRAFFEEVADELNIDKKDLGAPVS
jgi:ATP-dependent Zn protease